MKLVKDTFEDNPGLAELFKQKVRSIAKEVEFPEDLLDFESHIDMKGTYSENLARFYQAYPRLSEHSDFLRITKQVPKKCIQEWKAFAKRCGQLVPEEPTQQHKPLALAVSSSGSEPTEQNSNRVGESELRSAIEYHINYSMLLNPTDPEYEKPITQPLSEKPNPRLTERLKSCTHFLIIGAKNQGKSALGYSLLESHRGERPCFVYRPPRPDLLPSWIRTIQNLDELPENSVCLIDEASNEFDQYSSRELSNRKLAEILQIARHNHQSVILVSQTSKHVNLNLLYPIDVYLLKEPSRFQRLEERRLIRNAYKEVKGRIAVNEYYWLDNDTFEKSTFTKPTWFTDDLSKAYADYDRELRPKQIEASEQIRINFNSEPEALGLLSPLFGIPTRLKFPMIRARFHPAGIFLATILATAGLLFLVRGADFLAAINLVLASLGIAFAHEHFDRAYMSHVGRGDA